jgi:hypothetical protein
VLGPFLIQPPCCWRARLHAAGHCLEPAATTTCSFWRPSASAAVSDFPSVDVLGEVVIAFYGSESQMELGAGPEFMESYVLNGLIVLITIYILVRLLLRYFFPPDS